MIITENERLEYEETGMIEGGLAVESVFYAPDGITVANGFVANEDQSFNGGEIPESWMQQPALDPGYIPAPPGSLPVYRITSEAPALSSNLLWLALLAGGYFLLKKRKK